jgi:hypothetical protein
LNLETELQNYGVTSGSIRWLNRPASPEVLEYLDLVEPRKVELLLPNGVAESQGRPLLFFINALNLMATPAVQESDINHLRHRLASRGDRAYLALVQPGQLRVVPITLSDEAPDWRTYQAGTGEAVTLAARLALGEYIGRGKPAAHDFIFKEMFELLKTGADRLVLQVDKSDVLSLVGRALFFRFLRDRQVITDANTRIIAPKAGSLLNCFDTAENAAATCQWLDRTFNGDFLPLTGNSTLDFFDLVGKKSRERVFIELGAIVRGERPVGSEDYQLKFDWGDFDFAHVPVGLLSQVYEAFCWEWEPHSAKETSVHYTPRNIAATLVGEVFDQLPNASKSLVLDPACGAGLFLVLAFRRLYRERWVADGKRPETKDIREILEKQLVGFDCSDSALKLSALSLYLTAIELDPKPIPPEKLRFEKLQDSVLFNFRRESKDPNEGAVIGSLGPHLDTRFDGKFDLILSNPPWTSLPKEKVELAAEYTTVSQGVIRRKGEDDLATDYHNPDSAPDLPFIWKSTEWCKPNGRIAMALPARLLLKQEDIPSRARETLFRLLEVTGIINGSNLSDTNVWPDMQQPFILMFARNQRPRENHVVRFITPYYDTALNQRGEVRIDSNSAQPVEIETTFNEPWLWKTLAVGSSLDADVVRRVRNSSEKTLDRYWKEDLKLASGKGYQIVGSGDQRSAKFLNNLHNLDSTSAFRFIVDPNKLDTFKRTTVCWPRKEAIYEAPLVLVKEAPGSDRELGSALLCFTKIAYNESFCGYSAAGHAYGKLLVRYIHLFVHSTIWRHYALMTSAKFGAERRRFYKADLDDCPIIPLEALSNEHRRTVYALSERLITEDRGVFTEIDTFFGNLYGLDELDLEVIRDTLEVCLPYKSSRDHACRPTTKAESDIFCRRLESLLRPFFRIMGKEPTISIWHRRDPYLANNAPFRVLLVGKSDVNVLPPDDLFQKRILPLANETGATRIIHEVNSGLVIGILNQYRYWTPSRARLLAAEILRNHTSVFGE